MITILVTGIGGTRSIAVMNALRLSGGDYRVIGSDANYFNAGSYNCDIAYTVPFASDPKYMQRLEEIIATEKVDIIFATVEKEVAVLASNKEYLYNKTGVKVVVPDESVLDVCLDKYKTQQFLEHNGFTYIPSVLCDNKSRIEEFVSRYGLPLIRKPLFGYGSKGISIINSMDDIANLELDDSYVIQGYIDNEDSEQFYNTNLNEYTAEVFVNDDYSIAGGIILKRALHGGETVAGYLVKDKDAVAYLGTVAQKLGIKGPCNFQYRKKDGKIYIFEINPLYSGTTEIRASLGFNSVELAVSSFVRNEQKQISQESLKQKYFVRFLQAAFIEPKDMEALKQTGKLDHV